MKRVVAVAAASIEAVKAAQASVIHEMKERRGTTAFAGGAVALGAVGFGAAGGGAAVVEGAAESSLLIEVSR